jgi:hypothetical protein
MGRHSKQLAVGVFAAALALTACQGGDVANNSVPLFAVQPPVAGNGVADNEQFELCKYGSSGSFDYTVTNYGGASKTNPTVNSSSITLAAGECQLIASFGGFGADVTVTETGAATGFHLDHVEVTTIAGATTTGPVSSAGPSASGFISGTLGGGLRGVLAAFFNVADPPSGGEGCTPGYWKQSQHFDSWPAGYLPTDLFDTYFDDAFPGQNLLFVLSQGGGGLAALGRHTVSALLNAASSGVDYDLSVSDVVNAFNAAFGSGNYEAQKNIFAGFNEQTCPLN